ncbi:hypothetical protein B0T26DRAFT_751024 [Lasiosphaeria miniovina]|uniref:Uncharacterized protein n=1 Tax=Lasiosphaeria miniovina TaxID=1954250 RepID=A0AA40AJ97_9PEZI|nr:uncharacterized protein B0T26DRAFT_751024 [Lasiosphaeria miniovina]KAK0716878.1 hypothetical protein B0T26DRAFT_751024 [Lasiosphaeria miniovina]
MHLSRVLSVSVFFAATVFGGPTPEKSGKAVHNSKAEGRTWCPGNWLRSIADVEAAMSDLSIYCEYFSRVNTPIVETKQKTPGDKGHKIGGKQTLKDVTNTAQVHICNLLDTPILCSGDMINSARAAVIQACGKTPSGSYLAGYYYDEGNTYTIGFNNYGEKVDC